MEFLFAKWQLVLLGPESTVEMHGQVAPGTAAQHRAPLSALLEPGHTDVQLLVLPSQHCPHTL